MAVDYFIGLTMAQKKERLFAIRDAMETGQVVRHKSDNGVETEFDGSNPQFLQQRYLALCRSIALDPDYDATDPVQAACAAVKVNRRIHTAYPCSY